MSRQHSAAVRVYRIGLIDGLLRYLAKNGPSSVQRCAEDQKETTYEGLSCKRPVARIHELSNLAAELSLLAKESGLLSLTDTGRLYTAQGDKPWEVSSDQARLLRAELMTDPTATTTTGLLLLMLILLGSSAPLAVPDAMDRFAAAAGLETRWSKPTTRKSVTQYALNYLAELGLVTRDKARRYVITTEGTALLQGIQPVAAGAAPRLSPRPKSPARRRLYLRRRNPTEVSTSRLEDRLRRHDLNHTERRAQGKHRIGQPLLRSLVLRTYDTCCALCEVRDKRLLRTSHISRWSWQTRARLDPANVMLLCPGHDALFEYGLIGLTDAYELIVSPALDLERSPSLRPLVEQAVFRLPATHSPAAAYLAEHRRRHGLEYGATSTDT